MFALDGFSFTGALDFYLNRSFNLSAGVSGGTVFENGVSISDVLSIRVGGKFKFNNGKILKETSKLAPFFSLDAQVSSFSYNIEADDQTAIGIRPGIGVDYYVSEKFKLFAGAFYNANNANAFRQFSLGAGFSISKAKDSDGDGITDKNDICPEEAGPEENKGCPWPDTDGDGIIDKDDPCPTEAGIVNGCPDKDGDGIIDSEDGCPDVAGKLGGCPDSDGDGVADKDDNCPNEAGENGGCPVVVDSDGDGVPDAEDKCPNQKGGEDGCPVIDTDGDGVPDDIDDCPADAGENNGCPVYTVTLPVETIQFRFNSVDLLPVYQKGLDELALLMKEYKIEINVDGHSDSTGDEAYNMYLSQLRAAAVKQYLVDKGIAEGRITTAAFGITKPVAENTSRVGRAKNRRAELVITAQEK